MKTAVVRFKLDADMIVSLEAKSEEELIKTLHNISIGDLLEDGCVRDYSITEESIEGVTEEHKVLKVRCYDIVYDAEDSYDKELPEELVLDRVYVDNYNSEVTEDDIEEAIVEELSDETGCMIEGYKYEILKEYDR